MNMIKEDTEILILIKFLTKTKKMNTTKLTNMGTTKVINYQASSSDEVYPVLKENLPNNIVKVSTLLLQRTKRLESHNMR